MTLIGFLVIAIVSMIATRVHAPQHLALTAIFLTIGLLGIAYRLPIIVVELAVIWGLFYAMRRYFPVKEPEET